MTLDEWIGEASQRLAVVGIETSRLEAQLLAASAYGQTRAWLLTHALDPVQNVEKMDWLLARRLEHEPLSYILGHREFYGRMFMVSQEVLIPRQETETVVQEALSWIKAGDRVLDIGTGSGIIAITLALESLGQCYGSDISAEALFVAQRNAKLLDAETCFACSDLATAFQQFDIVVSNPPYIGTDEELQPEIVSFEPHLALYAADKGTAIYKRLASEAQKTVKKALILEVADGQADTVRDIFQTQGWTFQRSRLDLLGHERAVVFTPPG